jgi:hypothetical protein
MRNYIPDSFRDHDQTLIEIESLVKSVNNLLFSVGLHYVNKMTGQIKNDRFHIVRDSITSRIYSLNFHYKLLNSIHNPSKKIVTDVIFPMGIEIIPIYQTYLFDSIIFNSISLFDYIACMVNLIIEKNKDKWEKTWNHLENYIRNNDLLKSTKLGLKIIDVNKEWVLILNGYRSELIHYQTETLGANQTYNDMNGQLDVLVLAPRQLKKYFKQLKEISIKRDLNINAISLWIIKTCIEITVEILNEIDSYIEENRKIPDDKAIYIIVKNNTTPNTIN